MSSILNLVDTIAETERDMNEVSAGGGYTPPEAGHCPARLVGYVEVGVHPQAAYQGKAKPDAAVAYAIFELLGTKHPPREFDGKKYPVLLPQKMRVSDQEKSTMAKMFKAMNWEQKAKHFSQLLMKPFMVTVIHNEWEDKQGKKQIQATLVDEDNVPQVRAPFRTNFDDMGNELGKVDLSNKIEPALSEPKLFVWAASPEILGQLWDSIYIPGEKTEKYDPNRWQALIKKAKNLKGSAIGDFLEAKGVTIDIPANQSADSILQGDPIDTAPKDVPASGTAADAKAAKEKAEADALAALGM